MLFIKTPLSIYQDDAFKKYRYNENVPCNTYAEYNYLRPGIASSIRLRHFELCLSMTRDYFNDFNAIDFGCADGVFLPSLSKYFKYVAGIDRRRDFINISSIVAKSLNLKNVDLICNDDKSMSDVKALLPHQPYHVAYILEVLEHVGERERPWESRVSFLMAVADLLDPKGVLVVSVPKMVGPAFLIQRVGLALLGAHREPISWGDMLKAGLFCETTALEQKWDGEHLGFNHVRLEKAMRGRFDILAKKNTIFQAVYMLRRKS